MTYSLAMTGRMCLRLSILVFLATLCSSRLLFGQSQACFDKNPPPPVPVQATRISIVGIEFQGENPLSDALRAQLVKDIQQQERWVTPERPDSSWVDESLYPITVALHNLGYFKASVESTPYLVRALPAERFYVIRVAVESGPIFRLGNLRFASTSETPLVFPEALLRQQIRMQEGEVFDVSKIRDGLEAIYRRYSSKGYVDATPEPVTTIDESGLRIDLLISLDQQRPYRIAKTTFRGLDANAQNEPKLPQETGDLFNPALWQDFFKDNKPHLPPDASPDKDMQIRKDPRDGTLVITLDFRPCPITEPLED